MVAGKRKFKSFKTRTEAENALDDAKTLRKNHGEQSLAVSEASRSRYASAEQRLTAVGSSIEQAVDFFLKHNAGLKKPVTFAELIVLCLADKRASNKRPRYLDQLKCSAKAFARAGHGERLASEIQADDVRAWLRASGWAPKTQSVYLTDLRTVFAWGMEQRYCAFNPCSAVPKPEVDDKPPEIFPVKTCARLLVAAMREDAGLHLLGYVAVGMFAGIRPEEMARLGWDEIHLAERFIEVPARKSKTRRRRIVVISENLAGWLTLAAPDTNELLAPANLGKRLRALRRRARIAQWPHDVLRHCFASYHLAQHGSAEKTALQLGHHNTQMLFAHYRELVRPKDAAAFWRLEPTLKMMIARNATCDVR